MEQEYTYPYPRPMVTVDAVVFTVQEGRLDVLLIKRGHAPFEGMWALPGGFLDMDEEPADGAARELAEETGIEGIPLAQFQTFGGLGRDPRGRVLTIAYLGLMARGAQTACAGDDAADAGWRPVEALPRLASDHNAIVEAAVYHLRMLAEVFGPRLPLLPDEIDIEDLLAALGQCTLGSLTV